MYISIHGDQKNLNPIRHEVEELKSLWKNNNQQYEAYMPDLTSDTATNFMRKIFEPAVCHDVMFDANELSWLYSFAFTGCHNVRHNANGTIFISGNLDIAATKFIDKLEKIVPGCSQSPAVGGNFLITPSQYGLHNDSTRRSDWENSLRKVSEDNEMRRYTPWRNVLIPMWIGNTPDTVSHGVFFRQRHCDFAHVYNHASSAPPPATTYPICSDHSTVQFYDNDGSIIPKELNSIPYDEAHHKTYLSYTPRARLTGLIPEITAEWIPGAPYVFDAVQLHATNKGTIPGQQWSVKMGLLLTFLKEIK